VWRRWGGHVERHPHRWAVHHHSGHTVRRAGEDITVCLGAGGGSHVAAHNERHQRLPDDHTDKSRDDDETRDQGGASGVSDVVTDALARARRRVAHLTRDASGQHTTTTTTVTDTDGESRDMAASAGVGVGDDWAD
jgi:hypothetical protein